MHGCRRLLLHLCAATGSSRWAASGVFEGILFEAMAKKDMPGVETVILRLALAVVIGGVFGAEREYRNKSAGFRTLILICLGSCLFTIISIHIPNGTADRIASNIVTGIGFLGAGVIFKSERGVNGLTTAATIWINAALGMGIGAGFYIPAIAGAFFGIIVLYLFTLLERWIERINQVHRYRIVCEYEVDTLEHYEQLMAEYNLKFEREKHSRVGNSITGSWIVKGRDSNHDLFIKSILRDSTVKEFAY
jgi:putative Mg2+ transporter-C (MgtC) family protein